MMTKNIIKRLLKIFFFLNVIVSFAQGGDCDSQWARFTKDVDFKTSSGLALTDAIDENSGIIDSWYVLDELKEVTLRTNITELKYLDTYLKSSGKTPENLVKEIVNIGSYTKWKSKISQNFIDKLNEFGFQKLETALNSISESNRAKFIDYFNSLSKNNLERLNSNVESVTMWISFNDKGKELLKNNFDSWLNHIEARKFLKEGNINEVLKIFKKDIVDSYNDLGVKYVVDGSPDIDALKEAILIADRNDDVVKIADNTGISLNIIEKVKEHYFIKEHLIRTDKGFEIGRFERTKSDIDEWKDAIQGFEDVEDLKLFKRVLAHEYIESKLMEQGINYKSFDDLNSWYSYNAGAHDHSPLIKDSSDMSYLNRLKDIPQPNSNLTNLDQIVTEILKIYGIK